MGMVNLVVLACVLRATTIKKGRQLFRGRKVHPHRKSWLRLCLHATLKSKVPNSYPNMHTAVNKKSMSQITII